MFEAHELRKIIEEDSQPLRAMILLGINCAFGATDLAALPQSAIDLERGWVTFPRPKTAIERRAPLWPETHKALREILQQRREVEMEEDRKLVFLTRCRQRWVRLSPQGAVVDARAYASKSGRNC